MIGYLSKFASAALCCLLLGALAQAPVLAQNTVGSSSTQSLAFLETLIGKQFQSASGGGLMGSSPSIWEVRKRDDGRLSVPLNTNGYSMLVAIEADGRAHGYMTAGAGKREGSLEIGNSGFKFSIDSSIFYVLDAGKGDLHFIWATQKTNQLKLLSYQRLAAPRPEADGVTRAAFTANKLRAELLLGFAFTTEALTAALNQGVSSNMAVAVPVATAVTAEPALVASNGETQTPQIAGARVALVVGNSAYDARFGKLLNPVRDANMIASSLRTAGFQVELLQDADQKALKRALTRFGQRLSGAGRNTTGLFYYAGHGVQSGGTNYIVPIGAAIDTEADVDMESVAADAVLRQMEQAGIATSIIVLDACRNMPLARSFRDATRGLARMDAPNGSFVAYSTAPGSVAADGSGANSPFAAALVKEIVKPGQNIQSVFLNVRRSVYDATGGKQVPWESSSLLDTFVFTPAK